MSRRLRVLLGLLLAVSIFGAALLIRDWAFERVTTVRDVGFSGPAAVNPLLALQRLLELQGVETRSVRGFAHLPPQDRVLLVAAPDRSLGPAGAQRLLGWAATGGHLVIVPAPVGELLVDPLLEPLQVVLHRLPPTSAQRATFESRDELEKAFAEDPEAPPLGDLVLRYLGPTEPRLIHGDRAEAALLRLDHGAGIVTVIADGDVLSNERIGDDDNALLAWRALVLERAPAGAQLIHRDRRPSPWALLAGRAQPVAVALAVFVLAWLGRAAARFGPLLPAPEPQRRSLAEHVRAAGAWQWKCGAQRALIDAVRGSLHRALGRGHDEGLQARALAAAEEAGLDGRRVSEALSQRAPAERQDFTRVVRTLEELRRKTR